MVRFEARPADMFGSVFADASKENEDDVQSTRSSLRVLVDRVPSNDSSSL